MGRAGTTMQPFCMALDLRFFSILSSFKPRIPARGFQTKGFRLEALASGLRIPDFGFRISDFAFVSDFEFSMTHLFMRVGRNRPLPHPGEIAFALVRRHRAADFVEMPEHFLLALGSEQRGLGKGGLDFGRDGVG